MSSQRTYPGGSKMGWRARERPPGLLRTAVIFIALGLMALPMALGATSTPLSGAVFAHVLLLLACLVLFLPFYHSRADPLGAVSIFVVFYALATLSVPMSAILFGTEVEGAGMERALFLTIVGGAAFWMGQRTYSGISAPSADGLRPIQSSDARARYVARWGYLLIAAGAALLALLFSLLGGYSSYAQAGWLEKRQLTIGLGPVVYGSLLIQVGATLLLASSLQGARIRYSGRFAVAISATSILVAFSFLSGQRRGMVFPILSLLLTYHLVGKPINLRRLAVPGLASALFLSSFSQYRGYIGQDTQMPLTTYIRQNASLDWFNPAAGYFGASYQNLQLVVENSGTTALPFQHGASYLSAPLQWLPAAVYSARPLTPTELLAKQFFPFDYYRGGGRGFSVLAEAYWNFGAAGVGIVLFLVGLLIGFLDRRSVSRGGLISRCAYAAAGPFFLLLLVTIDFASAAKYAIIAGIPFLAVYLVLAVRPREGAQ